MSNAEVTGSSVSASEAISLAESGTWLIDVREQDEWDRGHAPAAHLVPLSELGSRLADVPSDQPVLIVCHSGARSLRATAALNDAGYQAVNVEGGMVGWSEAGGSVVVDGAGTPTVD